MNPMKDVEGVEKTRVLTYKAYVSMGNNSVKNSSIKNPKPHAHFHIIGRKSTKFQVNPMKDVGGVRETRSLGRTAKRTEGRTGGITHTWTDEGHFYSPPPPTSGDNNVHG